MRMRIRFPGVFLLLLAITTAAVAGTTSFPLLICGQNLTLDRDSRRGDIAAALARALPQEEPSVLSPERIQYDVIAAPGQGPVSLVFDFDAQGRFTGAILDAMLKEQNPVATQLAVWLTAEAGKGVRSKGGRVWTHAGFRFQLTEVQKAGDDSVYRMSIDRKTR